MNWHLFSAFLLITVVLFLTPGPIVTLIIATAARSGTRAALVTVAGASTGNAVLLALIALGLGWILKTSAQVFEVMRWLGAAYLIWLGIQAWRSAGRASALAPPAAHVHARRGFVDGRVLRLPTISVRPGRPNAAASSFASGIIREPLNGEESVCPVPGSTRLWLLSPRGAIEALVAGCEIDSAKLGNKRVINLPGLSVSVDDMIAALREVAGDDVVKLIRHAPDERVEKIVGSWPGRWDTTRAEALGLKGDTSFADVIRSYIADERR